MEHNWRQRWATKLCRERKEITNACTLSAYFSCEKSQSRKGCSHSVILIFSSMWEKAKLERVRRPAVTRDWRGGRRAGRWDNKDSQSSETLLRDAVMGGIWHCIFVIKDLDHNPKRCSPKLQNPECWNPKRPKSLNESWENLVGNTHVIVYQVTEQFQKRSRDTM